jgi:hypothetical protein
MTVRAAVMLRRAGLAHIARSVAVQHFLVGVKRDG